MGFEVVIDVIEKAKVAVSDEIAKTLAETHEALTGLPGDRAANIDFDTLDGDDGLKAFVKAAQQWAEDNGKRFTRVGDIKGKPNRLSFRVVTKRAPADPTPGTSNEPSTTSGDAGNTAVTSVTTADGPAA